MAESTLEPREIGRRMGVRAAIAFIHARALEMNDPSAKAALNTTAFHLGVALNNGKLRSDGSTPNPTKEMADE